MSPASPQNVPKQPPKSPPKAPPTAVTAPQLPYRPRDPKRYRPGIALVGCGGITSWHLRAYRAAGYPVVAFCDIDIDCACTRRDEYYPDADVTDDLGKVLARDDVEVVDIATHTAVRPPLVEAALRAGKHVLSQKPFVVDLDEGERLADLADRCGVKLAVNQNARWAPHMSYIREAVRQGVLGPLDAVHCDAHWDHGWARGTPFESIPHLILFDFAIHWFDFLATIFPETQPKRVFATTARSATQPIAQPMLAQAVIEFPHAQASLVFDGNTRHGPLNRTLVIGQRGTLSSIGPTDRIQRVELTTAAGTCIVPLEGCWFPHGFHGTMAELLCAVEERREPTNSARNNLASLALCFAAVASAQRGEPVEPGTVRQLPDDGQRR